LIGSAHRQPLQARRADVAVDRAELSVRTIAIFNKERLREGNQQRSIKDRLVQTSCVTTSAILLNAQQVIAMHKLNHSGSPLIPARTIAVRRPAAARTESRAVTGPFTAEYGPSMVGKKKTASTLRIATSASADAIRCRVE
jgi:hypothetical protein